jgi:hypothetical protein
MSYSEHRDCQQLHKKIDEYTSSITNFEFLGRGLNDLDAKGEVLAFRPVHIQIKISSIDVRLDFFDWSDDSGRTWQATGVLITGEGQAIKHGVRIRFNSIRGHTVGDLWKFTANPPESLEERAIAYDWVNDKLRTSVTIPVSNPSNVIISAESNYATFLILRKNDDPNADKFREEAERLIDQYTEAEETAQGGPLSNSENVKPQFTRSKFDFDDNLLGRTMGREERYRGSLDDW